MATTLFSRAAGSTSSSPSHSCLGGALFLESLRKFSWVVLLAVALVVGSRTQNTQAEGISSNSPSGVSPSVPMDPVQWDSSDAGYEEQEGFSPLEAELPSSGDGFSLKLIRTTAGGDRKSVV